MSKKITVREWIEKFNNGDFEDESFKTQVSAGWYDWFCPNQSLTKRLKKMGNIIKNITNDYILDNYYVWFKNNCPCSYPLYDDFRFEPLDENQRDEKYFLIQCDHPYGSDYMYEIATARNNYNIEFQCKNKSQVVKVINQLGIELENATKIIDYSSKITIDEINEMNQLMKNLKEITKDLFKNGFTNEFSDKMDKMKIAKKNFLDFFKAHNFIKLGEDKWNEFQEFIKSICGQDNLIIGGIYTYKDTMNSLIFILSDEYYTELSIPNLKYTNQEINKYISSLDESIVSIPREFIYQENILGYLGQLSDENLQKLNK